MPLIARFEDIASSASSEGRWQALEERAAPESFFLRWIWIGSWLETLAEAGIALPQLMSIREGERDVALALIGRGRVRRKLGSIPALWLNETGHGDGDRPFIEYNGLLCGRDEREACARAFCDAIGALPGWKALHLSGVEPSSPLVDIPGVRRRVRRDASPAYFIDLDAVREAEGDYLSLLSSNSRSQIRRAMKEEPGSPVVDAASDEGTVKLWLADMQRLNSGRHSDNAWDSAFFRCFVSRIILAGLADGSVELLKIRTGEEVLGYLVNFIWNGQAMNYQSAFAAPRSGKAKPGLLCHIAAVARYVESGLARYSLLAGKDRYKQSLSTGAEELQWWTLERWDWRLEAETFLRRILKR